jgi:hypothetical protein
MEVEILTDWKRIIPPLKAYSGLVHHYLDIEWIVCTGQVA